MRKLKAEFKSLAGDFKGGPLEFSLFEVKEYLHQDVPEVLSTIRN